MSTVGTGTVGIVLAAWALLAASTATANDSTAVLAAGGIQLVPNDHIALVSEDLRISREVIHVRYVFRNDADDDITATVAFPLPDIDLGYFSEVPVEQPYPDPLNFVGFTVTVDDRPVEPAMIATAHVGTRDVTAILAGHGIPLSNFAPDLRERLWALPRATQEALQADGIVAYDYEYENVYPLWTQRVVFHWQQTFPPGAQVIVEHSYRPVFGSSFVSSYATDPTIPESKAWLDEFCIGDAMRADIDWRLKEQGPDTLLLSDTLSYILVTANNWADAIGTFNLTVDAGDPGNMVATCFPGLVRTGETARYTVERTDFVPDADLRILIIRRDPES